MTSLRIFFGLFGLIPWVAGVPAAAMQSSFGSDADEAVYLERLAANGPAGQEAYEPLEPVPGATARPLPIASRPTLSSGVLEAARRYALSNNSKALLVWRDNSLQQSVYGEETTAATLINSRSMAKPLGAVAVGRALQLGAMSSLDQPAADFIVEWRGTPKAGITVRELLNMTSGLADQGPVKDAASIWTRAYLHPHHDTILINEYPLTAQPGTRYQYSNASADLIAVVIERATQRRYAQFISEQILRPIGAAGGQIWVDRPGGLAHSGCCILLPAETWLRLGLLLLRDGDWEGRRLLPRGFVEQMRMPSPANPRYGLGIWIQGDYVVRRGFGRPEQTFDEVLHGEPYLAKDLFLFDGNADQVLYMIPSRKLAVLRMGNAPPKSPPWDNAFLPNLILRDLARPSPYQKAGRP